jgi:6-phosphogluconolactonase/glucosamine-6-phosphate isomerase/deaminase
MMVTGAHKAAAVRALQGGFDAVAWPCASLGDHPNLDLILDRPAASSLA